MKTKSTFLFWILIILSATTFAQAPLVIDGFESGVRHYRFTETSVTDNPKIEGVNTSSKVLLRTGSGGSGFFAVNLTASRGVDAADVISTLGFDRISLKYYSDNGTDNSPIFPSQADIDSNKVFRVALRMNGSGAMDIVADVDLSQQSTWQTLTFNINPEMNYDFFQIRPNHTEIGDNRSANRYYIDDITLWSSTSTSASTISLFTDVSVMPNPSSGTASLKLSLVDGVNLVVKVYSLVGQLVMTVNDGYISAGNHILPFVIEPPGMYIMQVSAGSEKSYVKFVVK
ncbi:T9SS type A sorting domain-containing protein [Alkaliflexus imshenetskii]|uniref:T9SS type A sorting domain-containing protein n=1 Tax=Alkaliflexus imshenetskii TaxID=286730 RepID=UPI00047ECFB8|nr:T9SS type A sorting domain-containing protein [Alkaliflexus imshenetskii]